MPSASSLECFCRRLSRTEFTLSDALRSALALLAPCVIFKEARRMRGRTFFFFFFFPCFPLQAHDLPPCCWQADGSIVGGVDRIPDRTRRGAKRSTWRCDPT